MFRFLSSSFQHQGWVSQILISDIKWMSERYIWWVKSDWHFSVKFRQEWPHRGRRWIIMMERCICMWKPCRAALTEGFSCEKGWPRLPVTMFTTRRKKHCPFDICRYISWVATYLHICIYKREFHVKRADQDQDQDQDQAQPTLPVTAVTNRNWKKLWNYPEGRCWLILDKRKLLSLKNIVLGNKEN